MDDNQGGNGGFFKSKKILAGAGGGVLAFTSVVFGYIDSKIDDVNKRIDEKYGVVREYVNEKHINVEQKLNGIENILIRIENRVYELTKTKSKGE